MTLFSPGQDVFCDTSEPQTFKDLCTTTGERRFYSMLTCLCFQDVYDKLDYLSSLGKTQTAAVQRDADIGVAEAERDAGIRVTQSLLTRSWETHCKVQNNQLISLSPHRKQNARRR